MILYIVLTILCIFNILENNHEYTWLFSLVLFLYPHKLTLQNRCFLILLAIIAVIAGPLSSLIVFPLFLLLTTARSEATRVLFFLVLLLVLKNQVENINDNLIFGLHFTSLIQIFIPSIFSLVIWYRYLSLNGFIKYILGILIFFLVTLTSLNTWIGVDIFTNFIFRASLAIAPAVFISKEKFYFDSTPKFEKRAAFILLIACFIPLTLVTRPISEVYFDEGHGDWESTQRTFEENDFGRYSYYNYALLNRFVSKLIPTKLMQNEDAAAGLSNESLLVIKMPTIPFSDQYIHNIQEWVKLGGRLLIIGDHTDLYDTSTNINKLLDGLTSIEIAPNAVFDKLGMPVELVNKEGGVLSGDILPYREHFKWLTGTSFNHIPLGALTLSSYGSSFSEQGDYSKENRFGTFKPSFNLKYINHSSIISNSIDKGLVTVLLDSTMWSNFALFKYEYRQLFSALLSVNQHIYTVGLLKYLTYLLSIIAVFAVFKKSNFFNSITILFILGLILGCLATIGFSAAVAPYETGKSRVISVKYGSNTKFEFLRQLIKPGDNNYSRIVSSTAKYGFDPITEPKYKSIDSSRDVLYLEPDASQLPSLRYLSESIAAGSNVTILFNPYQAKDKDIVSWLDSIGITLKQNSANAISENIFPNKNTILTRKSPLLRKINYIYTSAYSNSIFKEYNADHLIQSYTIRPTTFPRKSGFLNIGFSADQFNDNTVGDVWEGIDPSSIGKYREQQLANILNGKSNSNSFPESLIYNQSDTAIKQWNEVKFILLQDNIILTKGNISQSNTLEPETLVFTGKINAESYLKLIHQSVSNFITKQCPKISNVTNCSKRYLAPDLTEWIVSWESGPSNENIKSIEINHDRNFSGLKHSYKLVYER